MSYKTKKTRSTERVLSRISSPVNDTHTNLGIMK